MRKKEMIVAWTWQIQISGLESQKLSEEDSGISCQKSKNKKNSGVSFGNV